MTFSQVMSQVLMSTNSLLPPCPLPSCAAHAAEPADWAKPDIKVLCKEEPLCEQCRAIKVRRARAWGRWLGGVGRWVVGGCRRMLESLPPLTQWAFGQVAHQGMLLQQKTGSCVSSGDHCLS